MPLGAAINEVAALMLSYDLDMVAAAVTSSSADLPGWADLRGRARIRDWTTTGRPFVVHPRDEQGEETTFSMPFTSRLGRVYGWWTIEDAETLPDLAVALGLADLAEMAEVDREEMRSCGARALISVPLGLGDQQLGAMSAGRLTPGPLPLQASKDLRVLASALFSRIAHREAEVALAAAVERGANAQRRSERLFASVGHELRVPLAATLGLARQLRSTLHDDVAEGVVSPEIVEDLEAVESTTRQVLDVADDMLAAGKAMHEASARSVVSVDLQRAADDVQHWLHQLAAPARVSVVNRVERGVVVRSTDAAVRQVLTNLVRNAINYAGEGSRVEISATSCQGDLGEARIRVTVADNGKGLDPAALSSVFEPFVRHADDSAGSGLGLALCRTLVERDGGAIGVHSQLGKGATFWFELERG